MYMFVYNFDHFMEVVQRNSVSCNDFCQKYLIAWCVFWLVCSHFAKYTSICNLLDRHFLFT